MHLSAVHALLSLLLVSVSVGLSNFAGAVGIGLSGINVRTRIRVGLAFGFFEALMPVLGLLLGEAVAGLFGQYGKYVGGAILILTGAYTIIQARMTSVEQKARMPRSVRMQSLIITALALSIDNLAVGFALAVYHIDIVLAALTFGVVSIVMSLLGLELGHRLGKRVEAWSEEIGGGVLILVGVAIAIGVLG
ncbi:MAG: manganese efflux pump [Chloroflexi bacterium]|nr:MAG: manganese efflux pump [Chloroflexota bacterium]TMD73120.1 MAG: manganese efflux pump [Chloroflexota bacterium]